MERSKKGSLYVQLPGGVATVFKLPKRSLWRWSIREFGPGAGVNYSTQTYYTEEAAIAAVQEEITRLQLDRELHRRINRDGT